MHGRGPAARVRVALVSALFVAGLLPLAAVPAAAATLPAGFTESIVASGIASPTAMAFAPDGRLFVLPPGRRAPGHQERRVAGDAVHDGHRRSAASAASSAWRSIRTSRRTSSSTSTTPRRRPDRTIGSAASPRTATWPFRAAKWSSSSWTTFRRDQPQRRRDPLRSRRQALRRRRRERHSANSQTLTNLLGKMLRINADGTIPTDNPYLTRQRRQPRDLGDGPAQPLHVRIPTRHRPACSSTTWARTPRRKSTTGSPARTTAGRRRRAHLHARPARPALFVRHGSGPMLGCAITGGTFYNPSTAQFPRTTRAATSLPTTAAAGSTD